MTVARPAAGIDDAARLRRDLGPTAWCALECLLERASDGVAVVSVRALAAELGVAKNTAHRAVAALRRAGLVEHVQSRRVDGRFERGHYRVVGLTSAQAPAPAAAARPPAPERPSRRASATITSTSPVDALQLSLLGPA